MIVLSPITPWLVGPITWLASLGTFLIEIVAIFFAELPIVYFPWVTGFSATILSALLILMVSAWLRSNLPRLKQASVAGLVVVAVATLSVPAASEILPGGWPLRDWEVVACDVGQGDALVIKSLGRVAVIDVGKDEDLIDACTYYKSANAKGYEEAAEMATNCDNIKYMKSHEKNAQKEKKPTK